MVLAIPFIFLNAVYLSRAIALGSARTYLGIYLGTAVFAVPLDIAMARAYGGMGIAIAIVLREIVMFSAFFFQSRVRKSASDPEVAETAWVEEAIDV
jgi:Na+-driven multidrug efflux pump